MDILYKNMIQAFQDKKPWFAEDGIPPVRYIDFYMGQTEHPEEFEFVYSAILMNYGVTWEQQGKYYVGKPTIEFHCVPPDQFPSASSVSLRRTNGLKLIKWYQTVSQVLDTVTGENSARLRRAGESMAVSAVGPYHILTYTSAIDALPGTEREKYIDGMVGSVNINKGAIVKNFEL